jgi:outer membrane protein assembly factor BamB/orotate phosphoribosyltransferase
MTLWYPTEMDAADAKLQLRKTITERVLVRGWQETISDSKGGENADGWLFDFRRVIMEAPTMHAIGVVFADTFKALPRYQVCGLEVAAIPLMTGITQYRYTQGTTDANGFFIRKSRKKEGLLRMIEGTIQKDVPIILVDDIMNRGKTFMRQIEVLEALGYTIHAVWTLLRYRDEVFYEQLHTRGIQIHSLFTLNDLTTDTEIKNLLAKPEDSPMKSEYTAAWKFISEKPNYFWVLPKSTPAIDGDKVYFGADNGTLWALNQADGSVVWSYKVSIGPNGKAIFSSPAVHDGLVYFGGYDGNFYALDAATGKPAWINFDADWIGSSPAIAPGLGLVFIGLEFGVWRKRGGIMALDLKTGKKKWWDHSMPNYTHATPLYIPETQQVAIGSNDGIVRLYDAMSGTLIWKSKTGDPSPAELRGGFSLFDIKSAVAYSPITDTIIAANMNCDVFAIDRKTGAHIWHTKMLFGSNGTPLIVGGAVYVGSMDKHLYCFDLVTGAVRFKTHLSARVFASPTLVEGNIVIGSNAGRVTTLDPDTGCELGYTTLTERITNPTCYSARDKRLFVLTYANELYCLERAPTVATPNTPTSHH